jgi:urea transport system substrate-binding protein
VISTINGDSNVPFYKELGNQGLKATDVPVVAFSVGEEELRGVDTKPLVGHLAAWNYFMRSRTRPTTSSPRSGRLRQGQEPAGHKDKPLTNDPMEATYIGIYMWAQAVEKAKSTDTDKVIAAMAGQTFTAPSGFTAKMDEKNHHLHKPVFIGEVKADGQFNVVWKTPARSRPSRGARTSPATTRRRTSLSERGRGEACASPGVRPVVRGIDRALSFFRAAPCCCRQLACFPPRRREPPVTCLCCPF